ncbi:GlxA family transcriptional regulator [Pseudoponticoccus marisrubri]|uniref:Transcriptional regulator n=1 Tax=Pseudoponticoccus marisrubri TaxID=1685382 RepID=A0A0W7WKC3_9RHOB|nr:GlxA family transcriptional regulator [Pseudoponticoccus marisrubri]KUF10936.1 transcriptional regulator [Pseudoponticoccus marisrubri]
MTGRKPDPAELVPGGAFAYPVAAPRPTRWFAFLLVPEFTLLAFSAALDPLRIANQLAQQPLFGWAVLSVDGRPVRSSSGVAIPPHGDLSLLERDMQLMVCSGNRHVDSAPEPALAALRRHARFGGAVGGICTGASTLARAGLLEGRRFTLHWENQPGFREAFPELEPTARRHEVDGTLMTCGGGAAATEMMVAEMARDLGRDFAVAVSDMCLNGGDFHPRDAQRSSIARAIGSRNPKVLAVLRIMYAELEEPRPLEALAAEVGLSRRQMERQFRKLMNESPASTYRNIRLDRARSLLMETDLTLIEVALATGFGSVNLLSRHYKARFGLTPTEQTARRDR